MSIFEDLRMIEYQGTSFAVLDQVLLEDRNYLGLASRADVEAAAASLQTGGPPRLPPVLFWVEEREGSFHPTEGDIGKRLLKAKQAKAEQAFLRKP